MVLSWLGRRFLSGPPRDNIRPTLLLSLDIINSGFVVECQKKVQGLVRSKGRHAAFCGCKAQVCGAKLFGTFLVSKGLGSLPQGDG